MAVSFGPGLDFSESRGRGGLRRDCYLTVDLTDEQLCVNFNQKRIKTGEMPKRIYRTKSLL